MNNKIKKITLTSILAGVSAVLMFFSFNVPLMPSFIKLDLSELPALFAAFTLGPVSGLTVCFIKNIVNLMTTTTGGIGELSNFLLACLFVLPAGFICKKTKNRKTIVISVVIGTMAMALCSVVTNYYIIYPIYFNFLPMEAVLGMYNVINPMVGTEPTGENLLTALWFFNFPFTIIKGILVSAATILLYKPLSPIVNSKIMNG